MKCSSCEFLKKRGIRNGKNEIDCKKNGSFALSMDFEDNFNCPLYVEKNKEDVTIKPDCALVILKCGRDIPIYGSMEFLKSLLDGLENEGEFIHTDNEVIRCSEVSAIQIINEVQYGR